MNNQENENDHLTENLQNRIENVCQQLDGLEQQVIEMTEMLTNYFISESNECQNINLFKICVTSLHCKF